VDPEKSEAAQSAALEEILAELRRHRPVNILQLVVQLQAYLTTEDDNLRTRSVLFLAEVLRKASADVPLDAQQAAHVQSFLEARLEDYPSLADALLGLEALVQNHASAVAESAKLEDHPSPIKNPVAALARDLSETVHLPALSQMIRQRGYRIFAALFSPACAVLRPLLQQEMKAVGLAFCTAVEGEKDPRCLLVALQAAGALLRLASGSSADDIVEPVFEVLSVYFPISFSPPKNDPFKVKPEDLKAALADVMFCRSADGSYRVAPHTQALVVEKLSEKGAEATVKEAIKAYGACIKHFPVKSLLPQAPHVVIQLLGIATSDSDAKASALETLCSLTRELELAHVSSFSRVVSPLVERCVTELLEGMSKPSGAQAISQVVAELAKAGPRTLGLILDKALNELAAYAMRATEASQGPIVEASQAAALVSMVSLTKAIDLRVEYTGVADDKTDAPYGFSQQHAQCTVEVLLFFLRRTRLSAIEAGDDFQLLTSCRCLAVEGCANLLSRPPNPLLPALEADRVQEILLGLSISASESEQVHSAAADAVSSAVARRPMDVAGTPISSQLLAKFAAVFPAGTEGGDQMMLDVGSENERPEDGLRDPMTDYVCSFEASEDSGTERDRLLRVLTAVGVTGGMLFVKTMRSLTEAAWAALNDSRLLTEAVAEMSASFCTPRPASVSLQDLAAYAEDLLALQELRNVHKASTSQTVLGALLEIAVAAAQGDADDEKLRAVKAVARCYKAIVRGWASIDRGFSRHATGSEKATDVLDRLRVAQAKCVATTCAAVTGIGTHWDADTQRSAAGGSEECVTRLREIFYNVISQSASDLEIFSDAKWIEDITQWIRVAGPAEDRSVSPNHKSSLFGALLLRVPGEAAEALITSTLSGDLPDTCEASDLVCPKFLAHATRSAFLRRELRGLDVRCLTRFIEHCLDAQKPALECLEDASVFRIVCNGEGAVGLQEAPLWRQKLLSVAYGQLAERVTSEDPAARPAALMLSLLLEHTPPHLLKGIGDVRMVETSLKILEAFGAEAAAEQGAVLLLDRFGALKTLQGLVHASPDLVEGHVQRLVPLLLDVVRDATAARCRYIATEVLFQMTELRLSILLRVRGQVVSGLGSGFGVRSKMRFGVDDPKKVVRRIAARTRNKWIALGSEK